MTSTKVQIDGLIKETDVIVRQILENSINNSNSSNQTHLLSLLAQNEDQINRQLENARTQINLERKLQSYKEKVHGRDKQLQIFLRRLKKSEQLLADSLQGKIGKNINLT